MDHPALAPDTVDRLPGFRARRYPGLRVPRYEGRRGHPIWLSRDLIPEFLALAPMPPRATWFAAHAAETEFLDVDDPGILADIDDPGAYRVLVGAAGMKRSVQDRRLAWDWPCCGRCRSLPERRKLRLRLKWSLQKVTWARGRYRRGSFQPADGAGVFVVARYSGPGVVIHEIPSIGIEPIAYVETMECGRASGPCWRGKFVISSIRLEDASINLTKTGRPEWGRWNFGSSWIRR